VSEAIQRLAKFIPGIKGISESNRKGLLNIVKMLEREQQDRERAARFALEFYADEKRHAASNERSFEGDPYTEPGEPYMYDVGRDWGELARSALRTLNK